MKTLGLLGGTGPESTIDYYRLILDEHKRRRPDVGNPPMVIDSVNFKELMPFMEARDWAGLAEWMAAEFEKLRRAGADFGLIAANTPHIAFDLLEPISPLPLLSIVEATAFEAQRRGIQRVGLLGTRLTMQGRFYPSVFEREGLSIVIPRDEDQDYVHEKYFDELFVGVFLDETRAGLCDVIRRMVVREGVEAVILGGTELPLILRSAPDLGVAFLDTAKIHCAAAVEELLA